MVHLFKKSATVKLLDGLAEFAGWRVFPSLKTPEGRVYKKEDRNGDKEIVFGKTTIGSYKVVIKRNGKIVHQELQTNRDNAVFWAGEAMAFLEW